MTITLRRPRRAALLLGAVLGGLLTTLALAPVAAADPTLDRPASRTADRAAVSGTGTLAYIRDHDVWVARQDGTGARRLTTSGTAAQPWHSPTQSDSGQVVAGRGALVYRMDQWGTVLGTLDPPDLRDSAGQLLGGKPAHLAVSPDGSKIAYTYEKYSCPVGMACKMRYVTGFTSATRVSDPTAWGVTFYDAPSWITNSRVAVNQDLLANIYLFDLGRGDTYWFDENVYTSDDRQLGDFEISRGSGYATALKDVGDNANIVFYRVSGNYRDGGRPPFPTYLCQTTPVLGIASPTWSADGALAAWQEPDGVWGVAMGDAPCETVPFRMIPGASQPSFSPARLQTVRPVYTLRATGKPRVVGRAVVGKRLAATRGAWSAAPAAYRFQWLRDGRAVRGATRATYRVTGKDRRHSLRVRVTASRPGFRPAVALSASVRVRR